MKDQAAINLDLAAYRQPVGVHFRKINYSIKCGKGQPDKEILKGLSGNFESGQLICILGPSGAGKTTLLNVLSGFKLSGVSGSIRYNDHPLDASTRKKCCHITQDSEMLQNLTLLETMTSAVYLKLGRKINSSVRLKIINDILQILGLEKCLQSRVKTLSGGEAKRLSIAVEMITNPPVMYFDEPTSGLDSSSSLQVMTHLRELAKSGRTIVCAIHQPSSRMLELIDQVYLLSKGTCLYSGPLSQMVHHFEKANFHCPPQYNRAEFALEVANNERYGDYEKLLEESDKSANGVQNPIEKNESVSIGPDSFEMEPMIVRVDKVDDNISKLKHLPAQYSVGFLDQIVILTNRSFKNSYRSLMYCQLRILVTAIVGMLLGSIFWQIGVHADHMLTNAACLYFFLLFIVFSNGMSTVVTFPFERGVFWREHMNNWYSTPAYVISKILASLPLQLICPTILICITYFMTGQPHDVQRFLYLLLILILTAVMADSLGLMVGAACSVQFGTFVLCSIFIPNLLFSGFFIKYSELPVAYRPLYSISFLRFGFEGSLNAIYGFDREAIPCKDVFCVIVKPQKFLKMNEMDGGLYWLDVFGLSVWSLCVWFLLYLTVCIRLRRSQ